MKESSTLGKTINYQEEFRKQPGPVRLFLFESRFLRSVSKGLVGIRCRERERERNKGSKATLLKLLEKFLVRPTPRSFPPILGTPLRTKPRRHTTLRPRELIRVPYFARLRRPSNINRQGRWRRQRRVLEPLDQEGGIPMERGLIAERKNWQQLRYRWLIDSELNP